MADRDEKVITAGFAFIDKLLAKDVKKGKMTEEEAVLTRGRISGVTGLEAFEIVDLVVEVRSCAHSVFRVDADISVSKGCIGVARA